MNVQFTNQFESGKYQEMQEKDILNMLAGYDDFKTWGFIGDPLEKLPINTYYLVPDKPLKFPKNIGGEVDFHQLSSVATTSEGSWFCVEFFYSFDEFKRTKFRGTFKIKICEENKLILDWLVRERSLFLLKKKPSSTAFSNPLELIKFFESNPGFFLELNDVTGLAFNEDYMELLQKS